MAAMGKVPEIMQMRKTGQNSLVIVITVTYNYFKNINRDTYPALFCRE